MSDLALNGISGDMRVTNAAISMNDVEQALDTVNPSFDVFNHSHTQFAWKAQNVSNYGTARNMRQITAELSRKRMALSEAKFKFLKKQIKLKKKLEKNETDELALLAVDQMRERMDFLRTAYEGCMKDVMLLTELHEQLKKKLIDEYGEYNEAVLEKDERRYWIKRLFAQSLRDIRQNGSVSTGDQECLEQINMNPRYVAKLCRQYLIHEDKLNESDCKSLETFLDESADLFEGNADELFIRKGLSSEPNKAFLNMGVD